MNLALLTVYLAWHERTSYKLRIGYISEFQFTEPVQRNDSLPRLALPQAR